MAGLADALIQGYVDSLNPNMVMVKGMMQAQAKQQELELDKQKDEFAQELARRLSKAIKDNDDKDSNRDEIEYLQKMLKKYTS